MSDDGLLQFAARATTPEQAARLAQTPDKMEYRAADIDRTGDRVKRIHVELSNGTIRLISYAYFVEAFSTSDRMMAFLYTQGALLLDGENLRALLPALQDESVTALRAYRPDYHLEPEAGAIVITRLEWQTREQVLEQA